MSSGVLAVVSLIAACGNDSTGNELDAADQTAADEMADSMNSYLAPVGDLTEQDTQCIAEGSVAEFGAPAAGGVVSVPPVGERIERAETEVDIYMRCTDNWELLFLRTRTEGAAEISDESAACVSDALADDVSRSMWITELAGGYTDLGHLDPLFAVLDTCLSVEELDALDWN